MGALSSLSFLLKQGDEIICIDDVYGGSGRLFNKCFVNFGITTKMVDLNNPEKIKESLKDSNAKV